MYYYHTINILLAEIIQALRQMFEQRFIHRPVTIINQILLYSNLVFKAYRDILHKRSKGEKCSQPGLLDHADGEIEIETANDMRLKSDTGTI